jgi:hypothetical protein
MVVRFFKVTAKTFLFFSVGLSFVPVNGMSALRRLATTVVRGSISRVAPRYPTILPSSTFARRFNAVQPAKASMQPSLTSSFREGKNENKNNQGKSGFWSRLTSWAAAGATGIAGAVAYWFNKNHAVNDPFSTYGRSMTLFIDEDGSEVSYGKNGEAAFYTQFIDILKGKSSSMLANASFYYTMLTVARKNKEPLWRYLSGWDVFECNTTDNLKSVMLLVPKSWGVNAGIKNCNVGLDLTDFVQVKSPLFGHLSAKFGCPLEVLFDRIRCISATDSVVSVVKKLFLNKSLDRQAEKNPWIFYVGGHGGDPGSFSFIYKSWTCGTTCATFQELLDHLNATVSTKFFTYGSCFAGSKERLCDLYTGSDGMPKLYNFPIVCRSFGNTASYATVNPNFANFLKGLAHSNITSNRVSSVVEAVIQINGNNRLENVPHIRWANSTTFDLLHKNATFGEGVVTVSLPNSTSYHLLNKQCVDSVSLSTDSTGKSVTQIISGRPAIRDHHIKEFFAPTICKPEDLSNYFLNYGDQKSYYIDTLIFDKNKRVYDLVLNGRDPVKIGGDDERRKELQKMAAAIALQNAAAIVSRNTEQSCIKGIERSCGYRRSI